MSEFEFDDGIEPFFPLCDDDTDEAKKARKLRERPSKDELDQFAIKIRDVFHRHSAFDPVRSIVREWCDKLVADRAFEELNRAVQSAEAIAALAFAYVETPIDEGDDLRLNFPLPGRELTMPERYVALAAILDESDGEDTPKIDPYADAGEERFLEWYLKQLPYIALRASVRSGIRGKDLMLLATALVDVEADLASTGLDRGAVPLKPPGRPKLTYEEIQNRKDLAKRWRQAREAGTRQADYAVDNGYEPQDFRKLINSVAQMESRERKCRSDSSL